jgi:hypothetical protein
MKNNKCKVCTLFDEKQLIQEVIFDINKLIKQKELLEVLNKQTGFNLSDYHYKKHRDSCLSDFELPMNNDVDNKVDDEIDLIKPKKSYQEMLNIDSIMDLYRKMSFEEKQINKLNLLDEIEYLVISNVHYQLIHGCIDVSFKHLVPKEDISSLKSINDIMKTKYEEAKQINEKYRVNNVALLLDEQIETLHRWFEEAEERSKQLKNQ